MPVVLQKNCFIFSTMADPAKRQRLSQVDSSAQTSSSAASMFTASQRDGAGGESRFVEGSIVRISMKNFL